MKRIERKDVWLLLTQVGVWLIVLLFPVVVAFLSTNDWNNVKATAMMVVGMLQAPIILYFINFYLLYRLFFRRRYVLFCLINVVLLLGLNIGFFLYFGKTPDIPDIALISIYIGFFVYFLLDCAVITLAIGIRHFIRTNRLREQLMEEKQKSTEAELAWLKNQINPHFLFNTLNNISSLTQIDQDKAQDAIAQLSDLLRYAMYETNKPLVPISGEVDFMRNYIELMRLRCNDRTEVKADFSVENPDMHVAPLLFISLIENAFKHGTSTTRPSSIAIRLTSADGRLVFDCTNTNFPKDDADRSGSGIGLENTRRRLELVYHDRYTWECGADDDGQNFHSHIEIDTRET